MASWYGRSKILGRCVDRNKKPWYRRYTDSLYGRTYRISWCSESGLSWYPYTTTALSTWYEVRQNLFRTKISRQVCKDRKRSILSYYSWCRTWCIGSIREEVEWQIPDDPGGMGEELEWAHRVFQLPDGHTKSYLHNKRYWVSWTSVYEKSHAINQVSLMTIRFIKWCIWRYGMRVSAGRCRSEIGL